MRIAVLGTGPLGSVLGRLFARCGHEVTFAYSRSTMKLHDLARDSAARHGSVGEAVDGADVVVLAVHWSRIDDVLGQAGEMAGQIVVNCCVPLDVTNTRLAVGGETSGAEALASLRPKAHWVCGFNTVPSEAYEPVFRRMGEEGRPQMLVYGDDAEARECAGGLLRDVGFEPREAGPLLSGRYVEPFALLTVELAYEQPGGPGLVYRFEKLR